MATIDIRTNKNGEVIGYRFRACVGRNEAGKQQWRTKTVKRPTGMTPVKERKEIQRQADTWEQEQKAAYQKGHSTQDKDRITLADFIRDHWWKDHVMDGTHTPSSISFFSYMSADIIAYFGEKKRLNQIDGETVKRYVKHLNTEAQTKRGKPYSKATIQHHFGTLRNILEYAKRFHYIDSDPCQDLSQKEKPQREKKQIDFLDSEKAREFLCCLDTEPIFWRCMLNVLITTGLRRGEAVGLQWRDISQDKLTITVQRNVTMDKNSPDKLHVGTTKGKEARTVPISMRVYGLLMQLKRQHTERYGDVLPHAYIFCRPADPYKPINPTEPTRWQRRFVKRHALENVSPHDLRHTAATLALEGGADLKMVQELLGHKDATTTMQFYAGVSETQQRRTVEGIEALLQNHA